MSAFIRRPAPRRLLILALIIAVGVAVQAWAATQWPDNFDSDEAIFGLMARHIAQGQFTPTVYGTEHLGSIESYIAAGFFSAFGESVVTLRIGTVLLFGLFLVLHAVFVTRSFGYPVALVSLLMLALPGFYVLSWTYRPIGAYDALLVLGTGLLVLAQIRHTTWRSRILGALASGLVIGLGVWSNQMIFVYVVALGLVSGLTSPEWAAVYARLEKLCQQLLHIPFREILPVAVMATAGVGILAFFSSGCQPAWQYEKVQLIARGILLVLGLSLGVSAIVLSLQKSALFTQLGALVLGFGLGYSPVLADWLVNENAPVAVIRKSCPIEAVSHLELMVKEILPGLWGVPPLAELTALPPPVILAWALIIGLICFAILTFVWRYRVDLWKLSALSPVEPAASPYLVVGLLLALPLILSVFASNTVDLGSVRHLLVAAQASSIVFAIFVTRLTRRSSRLGLPILVFWVGFVGLTNLDYARGHWATKFSRFDLRSIATLETYLEEHGGEVGFADYWGAFALDFITAERLTFAPYNGLNRYPAYTNAAAEATVQAFVFPLDNAPGPGSSTETLIAFLQEENLRSGERAAFPWILESLQSQSVSDRRTVADWDVWIVMDDG